MSRATRQTDGMGKYAKGWLHLLIGSAVAALPLLFALVVVWAFEVPRAAAQLVALLAVAALLTASFGLPVRARPACVAGVNALLGLRLPPPLQKSRPRTALWVLLHGVIGSVAVGAAAFLGMIAAFAFLMFLTHSDDRIVFLWIATDNDLITLLLAGAAAALAVLTGFAAPALLRAAAPSLLGHQPAERIAALQQRTEVLAHRNHLAQELHDSIGHTLTTSTIQAAVAAKLMESDPATARQALAGIEDSSRLALEELDHVIELLREEPAPRAPQRGLADVPALVEHVRRTGRPIEAALPPDLAAVPPAISREAYRIVQEALTNALRHGTDGEIRLAIVVEANRLILDISNPVDQQQVRRTGRGTTGIEDRARLLGGEASAGANGARWEVVVQLPTLWADSDR